MYTGDSETIHLDEKTGLPDIRVRVDVFLGTSVIEQRSCVSSPAGLATSVRAEELDNRGAGAEIVIDATHHELGHVLDTAGPGVASAFDGIVHDLAARTLDALDLHG